jgi:hypothetical protein
MSRRAPTAFFVLAVGAVVSASGGADGAPAEFPAFVALAAGALFFTSRKGALTILALISILSAWNNYDQSSVGLTAREIGSALLSILLIAIVVVGISVDVVLRLVWRSTRSLPPGA